MLTDERRDHLLLATDAMLAAWNDWSVDNDAKGITTTFVDAVCDCLLLWSEGGIPGDLRALAHDIEIMREHWNAWVRSHEVNPVKNQLPGDAFWRAMKTVDDARRIAAAPKDFTLPPIADLEKEGVSARQICQMYGFTDDHTSTGQPVLKMLYEEKALPGMHTGGDWLPPHARRQRDIAVQQKAALERLAVDRQRKIDFLTKPCKETIEELIEQGVSGKQIVRMRKIGREELAGYCATHGLVMPAWEPTPPNLTSGVVDVEDVGTVPTGQVGRPTIEPTVPPVPIVDGPPVIDMAEGPLTLEQEIVEYHNAGFDTRQIAEAVSRPDAEVSWQKVSKVLKRYQEDPEAFQTVEAE